MNGWFAVKRGITVHPLFRGHPERLAIWLWLLDNACWQDTPHDINGKTVMVQRGAVCASERRIAAEVGVGYQVVRTFLGRLKAEHMINAAVTHGRSIISLCNYEKYQRATDRANAVGNAALTHDQRTKEQDNNSVAKATGASRAAELRKQVFSAGKELLAREGVEKPGALISKWLKGSPEREVLAAILSAEGRNDPVAYIGGCLRKRKSEEVSEKDRMKAWGIPDHDEDDRRNFSGGGHHGAPPVRDAEDHLPGVFDFEAKESGPLPECDLQAGRHRLELLALRH